MSGKVYNPPPASQKLSKTSPSYYYSALVCGFLCFIFDTSKLELHTDFPSTLKGLLMADVANQTGSVTLNGHLVRSSMKIQAIVKF